MSATTALTLSIKLDCLTEEAKAIICDALSYHAARYSERDIQDLHTITQAEKCREMERSFGNPQAQIIIMEK